MKSVLDTMRTEVDMCGKSRYRISKDTGISQSLLCRLMNGERGLSIENLELLAEYLELDIVIKPKNQQRKGR